MDNKTRGAWVVHHADKLRQVKEPGTFENILVAGKAATVLSAVAATETSILPLDRVRLLAKANGVNPLELDSVLTRLEYQQLIQRAGADVQVLAVTTASVLQHTARLLDDLSPTPTEEAALQLAEIASQRPVGRKVLVEQLGDEHYLGTADVTDLLYEAEQIGFVDAEGTEGEKLYFNGNLFRRDDVAKTQRVLDSLGPEERQRLASRDQDLRGRGCVSLPTAERMLGTALTQKATAVGLFDVHGVENEKGTTLFVTRPGAFSKFSRSLATLFTTTRWIWPRHWSHALPTA
jgi:hypothetical protein